MKTLNPSWIRHFALLYGGSIITILFPSSVTAKSLWSTTPATYGNDSNDAFVLKTGYLVGNGKLGGNQVKSCTRFCLYSLPAPTPPPRLPSSRLSS